MPLIRELPDFQPPPQEETPTLRPSAFAKLFPNPTGTNGYEDLVQAVDIVVNSKACNMLEQMESTPTLRDVQSNLANPEVKRSLELLRNGMSKPVVPPYVSFDPSTTFPEFAGLRQLARLLVRPMGVEFARGNATAGIEWIDIGMRFGHSIQQGVLIAGLVGIAIESIVLARAVEHVEKLSKKSCTDLLQVVKNRVSLPSPVSGIIRGEYSMLEKVLDQTKNDPAQLGSLIGGEEPEDESEKAVFNQLKGDPAAAKIAAEKAIERLYPMYDHAIQNAGLPPWKRTEFKSDMELDAQAKFMIDMVMPTFTQAITRYDQINVQYRILAVKILLRRYRWDYDRYPDSLAVFEEKELTEDLFTGQPMNYQLKGERYTLSSIGPIKYDDNGNPTNQRVPVTLPRVT